jgi:serine/alanine adding enzyme
MTEVVDRIPDAAWHSFLQAAQNASAFVTPEVIDVQRRTRGQRVTVLAAGTAGRVVAMMPLVTIAHGPAVGRWLTARRVVHGLAHVPAPSKQLERAARNLLDEAERRRGSALLTEIRHHDPVAPAVAHALSASGYRYEPHLEIEIPLEDGPDAVLAGIGRSTRKRIRRGERQGWATIDIVGDERSFDEWYRLLRATYRRARVPLADRSLFEAAYERGAQAGFWMLLARVEGAPAAASLELAHADTVYGWYGGVDRRFSARVPNELLTWTVLRRACENGFARYAFGGAGVPDASYGVRDFKSKFGGTLLELGRHVRHHAPLRAAALRRAASAVRR